MLIKKNVENLICGFTTAVYVCGSSLRLRLRFILKPQIGVWPDLGQQNFWPILICPMLKEPMEIEKEENGKIFLKQFIAPPDLRF